MSTRDLDYRASVTDSVEEPRMLTEPHRRRLNMMLSSPYSIEPERAAIRATLATIDAQAAEIIALRAQANAQNGALLDIIAVADKINALVSEKYALRCLCGRGESCEYCSPSSAYAKLLLKLRMLSAEFTRQDAKESPR